MAEPIIIDGNPYREIETRYRYEPGNAEVSLRCPACRKRSAGIVWGGWFTCDYCSCIALVSDGRAFVRRYPPPRGPAIWREWWRGWEPLKAAAEAIERRDA